MRIYNTPLNRRSIIRWKVYFDRSRMYIGYIQFFLIGVVFFQSFRESDWGSFIFRYAWIAVPVALLLFIFLSLLLGYFDSKLGLREEEMRNLSSSNPVLMEILESIKNLESEVKQSKLNN